MPIGRVKSLLTMNEHRNNITFEIKKEYTGRILPNGEREFMYLQPEGLHRLWRGEENISTEGEKATYSMCPKKKVRRRKNA